MIGRQVKKGSEVYTINGVQSVEHVIEVTVYQNMEPICQCFVPDFAAKQLIKSIQEYINTTDEITVAGIKFVFQDIEALCFGKGGVS